MSIAKRIPIYLLGFTLAPLIAGITMTISNMGDLMIRKAPEQAPASLAAPGQPAKSGAKHRALILLGSAGTEITDLLGAYGVLSESGLFDVRTVATDKRLLGTTSDVAVIPDFSTAEAPAADVIVVPSVLDPGEEGLVSFLRARAQSAKLILALGEGARLAARAGIFTRRNATSHFLALGDLAQVDPTTYWVRGARYVSDGNTISSSGVISGVDATFFAIERIAGRAAAEKTAASLHYRWNREPDPSGFGPGTQGAGKRNAPSEDQRLTASDYLLLFMHGGYEWSRKQVAVALFPGVSEIGLAAALDTFPRMQSARVSSIWAQRDWVRTRHGLALLPGRSADDALRAGPSDLLVVPSGMRPGDAPPTLDPLQNPELHKFAVESQAAVKSALYDAPGKAFEQDLALIAELEGPKLARFVAKLLVAPQPEGVATIGEFPVQAAPDWTWSLWFRPFLIGILGVWAIWVFDRMLFRPRSDVSDDTRAASGDSKKRVTSDA